MGRMKAQWMDEQSAKIEEARKRKLAEYLKLTFEEVDEADPEFDYEHNYGVGIRWTVTFSRHTRKAILDKLNGQTEFEFGPDAFDRGDYPANESPEEDFDGNDFNEDFSGGFIDVDPETAKKQADELRKQKEEGDK